MGLASQINTNDNLLHMPRHNNNVLVRNKCPPPSTVISISIKHDFICARSVGPCSPPEKEKRVRHVFFLSLENCFSRAAWNLFDFGNQLVPTHLANNMPFGSFQCSLEGLRHALILPLPRKLFFWGCMESSRFLGINWYQLIWQIHSTRCIPVLFALSLCLYVYP